MPGELLLIINYCSSKNPVREYYSCGVRIVALLLNADAILDKILLAVENWNSAE